MVNVFENGEIIADVDYNNNLDVWTGQNWESGGTGKHKGLTRLEDGRFVLIHGSDWQGVKDFGEVISKDEALHEILKSEDRDLLDEFDLREFYEQKLVKEKKTWSTKSIKVDMEVHNKLTALKNGNMSYNDVIGGLLSIADEKFRVE